MTQSTVQSAGGLLLCLALPAVALGQGFEYPPVIPDARVETFKTVDGVALDVWIFEPEGHRASDARPAMVFFFGGGWAQGSPAQFAPQARALTGRGMVTVLADYRVLNRHDTRPAEAVEDAKSAVRWVRTRAGDLGVDPERIGAAGGSAGGHLAAATATLPDFDAPGEDASVSSTPNALVLFNPVVIVASVPGVFELDEGLRDRMDGLLTEVSPYHHLGPDAPPTLILHGVDDELVPVSSVVAYCGRAVELGSPCEVVSYEGAGHGFFNRDPFYEPTLQETIRFLAALGWVGAERGR